MPLKNYGLLKGKAIDVRLGAGPNPHYQVRLIDDTTDYRIAINVQSKLHPSELEYAIVDPFHHPILDIVSKFSLGFTEIERKPHSGALDYIRGNLFHRSLMKPLPANVPGLDNDLNEKIHHIMQRAMADEEALIYAFGERWGPEKNKKDKYFGFSPGNGIHDIHMNQSNVGQFVKDDGVWQDGGLLIHFPVQNHWIALFLKFQSQSWHSDDKTGHKLPGDMVGLEADLNSRDEIIAPGIVLPTTNDPKGLVRIIAALVNSIKSPEIEFVTLINSSPAQINLDGWLLKDSRKNQQVLSGTLAPGETEKVKIGKPLELSNKGGIITLLNGDGLKVDGVAYTKAQAANPGWTIVF